MNNQILFRGLFILTTSKAKKHDLHYVEIMQNHSVSLEAYFMNLEAKCFGQFPPHWMGGQWPRAHRPQKAARVHWDSRHPVGGTPVLLGPGFLPTT